MGPLSNDDILSILILNAMNQSFAPLQHSVSSLSNAPNFNSELMARRVLDEDAFILRRLEAGQSANPYSLSPSSSSSSAFAALSTPRPVCANCKKGTHGTDYCIAPGGKMAGRTIEEARAAHATARDKQPPRTAHIATPIPTTGSSVSSSTTPSPTPPPSNTSSQDTFFLNGKLYGPVQTSWNAASVPSSAHIAEMSSPDATLYPFHAFLATVPGNLSTALSASSSQLRPFPSQSSLPFIIDTGASCHISPVLSDFKSIRPIKPHPITGLGDHSVAAVGMGTIELHTPSGALTLFDALYVPSSSVRLISVFLLGEANFNAHFYPRQGHCYISNADNSIVAHGTALPDRKLFVLSSFTVTSRSHPSFPSSAHYASRRPDVDSWHKRLGHCGPRAVLDMARSQAVEGMLIDTSNAPPKCEHCILGKQTRSSVPKLREGARATSHLERVFIDLCGPMSIPSRSGRLYSMNIIDDYSSFVWSLPLRSKDEAAPVLKHWLTALEVQTPHRLRSFVTDNGELASSQIQDWCSQKGILHLFTAPYTSAHNGRAERLHRTLLDKARAMISACKAPTNMWDEFCATAAYLTNLTGTTANNGKTPSELWYGNKPSVSHLREIGCRAFALIPTHNPKIHHRSVPCLLIGYAPNSKAYRLWDPFSDRVFNSYHVSFIELRELPTTPPPNPPDTPSSAHTPATNSSSLPVPIPLPPTIPSPSVHPHSTHTPSSLPAPLQDTSPTSLPPSPPDPMPPRPTSPPLSLSNPISASDNHYTLPRPLNDNDPINAHSISVINPSSHINPNSRDNLLTIASTSHTVNHPSSEYTNEQSNTVLPQDPIPHQVIIPHNPPITITPPSPDTVPQLQPPSPPIPLRRSPRLPQNIPPSIAPQSPPPAPLRRSPRLHPDTSLITSHIPSLPGSNIDPRVSAFLAEYAPVRDTHCLFPVSLDASSASLSVSEVLAALTTGNTQTILDDDDDPAWSTALNSAEREYWIAGARDELKSLQDLNVFVLVPRSDVPRNQRPLKGKLVCKRKRDDSGNIARYKVRYVAKGFAQRYRIDYNKTTAPTARLESFRSLLHIAAVLDWDIQHVDIKTAFLHGVLPESETVFMEQPPGFEVPGKEDWVMRLIKSLYGMKQASRIWNQTFHKVVSSLGFNRLACEWCVYRRKTATGITIFAVHVDDIISISSSVDENSRFKAELRKHWQISDLGAVKYALGIAIVRDRASRTISLSQTALIDRIVEQFGQLDAHPVDTPMVLGTQIVRPDKTIPISEPVASWSQRTPYRSLVGTLNYLAVATRPDIAFAVGRLATVLDCYRPEHWEAAIRVVRYLKGTRLFHLALGGSNVIHPLGFADSDYNNCLTTSRSIGGYCLSLGSGMVSWASHKHPLAADSSCYAEYISLHDASHEVIFLRQLLEGLEMLQVDPTPLYCDNDASRQLTEDQRWHAKVRHFRVKYHSTRELVDSDELKVIGVRSCDNTADILTKPLPRALFERFRGYLGLSPPRET